MGLESLVALVAQIGGFSITCMTANSFGIDPPTRLRSRASDPNSQPKRNGEAR